MAAMSRPPSGQQYEIAFEDQSATIVEVGGGIRRYSVGERDVLDPYDIDQMSDGAHGASLIPFPNRLADGRYAFEGAEYQMALTEPDKHNAIHGFLRWRPWTCAEHAADRVTMAATLFPLTGYPFTLDLTITYRLGEGGLTVTTTATNVGAHTAPYGSGHHPYLSAGDGLVDACTLELEADRRIVTDPERQLPTGLEAVEHTPYDFRSAKKIDDLEVDYAFTGLTRDSDGRAWVRLHRPDGVSVGLWVDEAYPIIELYTGDTLSADRKRRGLGVEPMTCPPNAFQSGDGVAHLAPGASITCNWGVVITS